MEDTNRTPSFGGNYSNRYAAKIRISYGRHCCANENCTIVTAVTVWLITINSFDMNIFRKYLRTGVTLLIFCTIFVNIFVDKQI